MDTIKLECPNCKAPLTVERGRSNMFCEYCGTKIAITDAAIYREDAITERHRITEEQKTRRELEQEKLNHKEITMLLLMMAGLLVFLFVVMIVMSFIAP